MAPSLTVLTQISYFICSESIKGRSVFLNSFYSLFLLSLFYYFFVLFIALFTVFFSFILLTSLFSSSFLPPSLPPSLSPFLPCFLHYFLSSLLPFFLCSFLTLIFPPLSHLSYFPFFFLSPISLPYTQKEIQEARLSDSPNLFAHTHY